MVRIATPICNCEAAEELMSSQNEYSGFHADCYVLVNNRTKKYIHSFLDRFIPNREESANEYEVPQYSDNPLIIFQTADELITHLAENLHLNHTIYWRNKSDSELQGAMCFFTNDGNVIVGLYCHSRTGDPRIENEYFRQLKEFCHSEIGYIAYEEPADHSTAEFIERSKLYNG